MLHPGILLDRLPEEYGLNAGVKHPGTKCTGGGQLPRDAGGARSGTAGGPGRR